MVKSIAVGSLNRLLKAKWLIYPLPKGGRL